MKSEEIDTSFCIHLSSVKGDNALFALLKLPAQSAPPPRLTVSLPAMAPDGERGDRVAGDSGRGRGDLHLDAASALFVVAL